ncbi:MAG: DUF4407 domain-containing protein [Propionibacteriaceae bacterium]|jgi:hypothetical protein|nr:DUF4407 domain-containing protein [Propionibacteriaceae bacterium]
MARDVREVSVLLSSPLDAHDYVMDLQKDIDSGDYARIVRELNHGVRVSCRNWMEDPIPGWHPYGAQSGINDTRLRDADIVVAVFLGHVGTPWTDPRPGGETYASGTIAEIHLAHRAGKPIRVYCLQKTDGESVSDQLTQQLSDLRKNGFTVRTCTSTQDLISQARKDIAQDLRTIRVQRPEGASLPAWVTPQNLVALVSGFVTAVSISLLLPVVTSHSGELADPLSPAEAILSVFFGLVAGIIVIGLYRALGAAVTRSIGPRRVQRLFLCLWLAAAVGTVVTTPLTLQIFHGEISVQVKRDQDQAISTVLEEAANSPVAMQLAETQAQIVEEEAVLRSAASDSGLAAAQASLDVAVSRRDEAQAGAEAAYLLMVCEREGRGSEPSCQGKASSVPDYGPVYQELERQYEAATMTLQQAQADVDRAETVRDAAQAALPQADQDSIEAARLPAEIRLCGSLLGTNPPQPDPECKSGLRRDAIDLNTTLKIMKDTTLIKANSGLCTQLKALYELQSRESSVGIATTGVICMFMMAQMMPMTVQVILGARRDPSRQSTEGS